MLVRFACNIVIKKKKKSTAVSIQPWSLHGDGVDVLVSSLPKMFISFFSKPTKDSELEVMAHLWSSVHYL